MLLRFTIRDLMLIVAVLGLGVGWWVDHTRTVQLLEQSQAELSSLKDRYSLDHFNMHPLGSSHQPIYWNGQALFLTTPQPPDHTVELPKQKYDNWPPPF